MSTPHEFQITYEVNDGYAGGSRPQTVTIYSSNLEDDFDNDDLRNFLSEIVQEDFECRIFPEPSNEDAFMRWAQDVVAEKNSGDFDED